MSPHTDSPANMCVTPILCVPILPISPVHVGLCMCARVCHCSCILGKYVPVIVFPGVCVWVCKACVPAQVSACVQISVCNYSDGQGNCPPSPNTKRILILSGLTVPPNERRGVAISFLWRTTRVNCLAFCSRLWWKRRERKAEKPWGCRLATKGLKLRCRRRKLRWGE